MKRNEYKLLLENWNNFLIEEEKRIINENLLVESFLLREFNVKKLAKQLGASTPGMLLFLASHIANASPQAVYDGTASAGPAVESAVGEMPGSAVEEAEKLVDKYGDQIKGKSYKIIDKGDSNLEFIVVTQTGGGRPTLSYAKPVVVEVKPRIITKEEQDVIKLLKLYDQDSKAFGEKLTDKQKALLCSFGYCYTKWLGGGNKKYSLLSTLYFNSKAGFKRSQNEVPEGEAVAFHEKSNTFSNKTTKNLLKRIQKLGSSSDKRANLWGRGLNEFMLIYQNAWQMSNNAKIKSASKTYQKTFAQIEKISSGSAEGDILEIWNKCVETNENAWFEGLKAGYVDGVKKLYDSKMISETAHSEIINMLTSLTDPNDLDEIFDVQEKIKKEIRAKIYNDGSIESIADIYDKLDAEKN